MIDGETRFKPIPKEILWEDYYENLHGAYNSMRNIFQGWSSSESGTQDDIAIMLGVDKSLVSRRLNGTENLTLKTLSFMGTAMNCRVAVNFIPYQIVGTGNQFDPTPVAQPANNGSVILKPSDTGS